MYIKAHMTPNRLFTTWNVEKYNPPRDPQLDVITARFDGGLSKAKGPYGSYRINNGQVHTVSHDPQKVLTANQAEIWTFIEAVRHLFRESPDTHKYRLCVYGDSKIALSNIIKSWLSPVERKDTWDDAFWETIKVLRASILSFGQVAVKWQKRDVNVRVFGH